MAQPFDADSLSLQTEKRASSLKISSPRNLRCRRKARWHSRTGDNIAGVELASFSHAGLSTGSLGRQIGVPGDMRFSPNGKVLAVSHTVNRVADLYLHDLDRKTVSRFTFNGGRYPLWTADGARIVFRKPDGIYVKPVSGGDERRVFEDTSIRNMSDLSPDGRTLLVGRSDPSDRIRYVDADRSFGQRCKETSFRS